MFYLNNAFCFDIKGLGKTNVVPRFSFIFSKPTYCLKF